MNTIVANGSRIRYLRILNGHSIRTFAKETNLDPLTIQKIEKCKSNPNPSTAKKICNALEVKFDDLFEIIDRPQKVGA